MADFKKLKVWQKAHELDLTIHRVATSIRGPMYISLRSQMIRAAMSVAANIVEGRDQKSDKQFAKFLRISLNSASELEYLLIVAHDFGLITNAAFETTTSQLMEVRKMLRGLLKTLEA